MKTTDTARTTFVSLFPSLAEAIAFEQQALSIGAEFLPECARAVLADREAASPEYYAWLCEQVEPEVEGLTVEQAAAVESAAIKDAAAFFAEFGEAFDTEETDWEAVAWTSGVSEEAMPGASGEQQAAGLALYTAVLTRETARLADE